MSVKAVAKNVAISPRKMSIVAGLVRGRSVEDAIVILRHTPRHASTAVRKAVESARANAENTHGLKADTLQITQIIVTPGRRLKRFRPAAHGRALPFQRKTSHITVVVDGEARSKKAEAKTVASSVEKTEKTVKAPAKKTTAAKAPAKKSAVKKPAAKKESK